MVFGLSGSVNDALMDIRELIFLIVELEVGTRCRKFVCLPSNTSTAMKKGLLLLAAASTLVLGACNKQSCPAYGKADTQKSEAVASAAASADRQ
jgi:hypothetical protein